MRVDLTSFAVEPPEKARRAARADGLQDRGDEHGGVDQTRFSFDQAGAVARSQFWAA